MSTRTQAREAALQILYQADATGDPVDEASALYWDNFAPSEDVREFTNALVDGVKAHMEEIDALIVRASINWRLDRMPRVDRNVLRIAVYELLHTPEVPVAVAINEAIEIGKKFGTEESGSFINGILDRVASETGRSQ
jgi:N utilization substance protein B